MVLLLEMEDLHSGWVNYEWTTFDTEIIARRKKGKIFVLMDTERLTIDDLPWGSRQHQVICIERHAPRAAIEELCGFLAPALRAAKSNT